MSTLRRLAAVTAATAGALLGTLAITATPAYAADTIEVSLSGVSSNTTAGARSFDSLSAQFRNRGGNLVTFINAVFTIHLDGMPADGVKVQRVLGVDLPQESAGDGTVRINDPGTFELLKDGRRTIVYLLQFTSTAPSGKASITLEAFQGGTRLGGASASTTVRGSTNPTRSTNAPSTQPPNTNPGIVPTFEAGPTISLAPLQQQTNDLASSDVPVSLYVMGGLLVVVGGVILYLIFRPQRQLAGVASQANSPTVGHFAADPYDDVPPPSLGYPSTVRRTAELPSVRDAQPPGLPRRPRP